VLSSLTNLPFHLQMNLAEKSERKVNS
jgi:hypothetical protein